MAGVTEEKHKILSQSQMQGSYLYKEEHIPE
jgi:hypothetical protein